MSSSSSLSSSSPLPSPAFLFEPPTATEQERGRQEHHHVQPTAIEAEDYGFWDSAPYFGGGDAAPIPHAFPNSVNFDVDVSNSEQT